MEPNPPNSTANDTRGGSTFLPISKAMLKKPPKPKKPVTSSAEFAPAQANEVPKQIHHSNEEYAPFDSFKMSYHTNSSRGGTSPEQAFKQA